MGFKFEVSAMRFQKKLTWRALSSFQTSITFEISDLKFETLRFFDIDLSKPAAEVDRRQIIATEATRPSGASTVETDPH